MSDTTTAYPEHEKLEKIVDKSQAIGEFVEWLSNQGISLMFMDHDSGRWFPNYRPVADLTAEFFEIDLKELEREKRAMLTRMRELDARTLAEVTVDEAAQLDSLRAKGGPR